METNGTMRTIVAVLVALPVLAQPPVGSLEFLEQRVAQNPENLRERGMLLQRYFGPAKPLPEVREARRKHIFWLIEHHPEFADLAQAHMYLDRSDDPEGHEEAARMWKEQVAKPGADSRAIVNAVAFFRRTDVPAAYVILEAASKSRAADPALVRARGELHALTILGVTRIASFDRVTAHSAALRKSPEAGKAFQEVEASDNPDMLGSAGDMLFRHYLFIPQFNFGGQDPTVDHERFLEWSERWLTKAHQIAPKEVRWTSSLVNAYVRHASFGDPGPAERLKWLRQASALMVNDNQRASVLPMLALAEFENGNFAEAERAAEAALKLAATPRFGSYPDLVHVAETVLGRIALDRGEIDFAKVHLLTSALAAPPGVLRPNLTLAQDLLDAGERDVVLVFLENLRAGWIRDEGAIDHLITVAKSPRGDLLTRWSPEGRQLVGRPAPVIKQFDSAAHKPTLLFFRTASCATCDSTAAILDKLVKEYAPRGVTVVTIDGSKERSAAAVYAVEAYPSVVAIDAQNLISGYVIGAEIEINLRRNIDRALQTAEDRRTTMPAPVPRPAAIADGKATLAWAAVEGAESYVVAWESDRDPGFVRVIATRETTAVLELPAGVAMRWRVQAAGQNFQQGKRSAWQEIPAQ